jgi:hypothetical protein
VRLRHRCIAPLIIARGDSRPDDARIGAGSRRPAASRPWQGDTRKHDSGTLSPLGLLVDGQWLRGEGRRTQAVTNPATGAHLADVPLATEDDLDRAAQAAATAFQPWRRVPPIERAAILQSVARCIRRDERRLATILTLEQGKRHIEALQEVRNSADTFEWMAEEGKRAYGRIVPARTRDTDQFVRLEPVGPIAAFSPWNFPAVLASRKVATRAGGRLHGGAENRRKKPPASWWPSENCASRLACPRAC